MTPGGGSGGLPNPPGSPPPSSGMGQQPQATPQGQGETPGFSQMCDQVFSQVINGGNPADVAYLVKWVKQLEMMAQQHMGQGQMPSAGAPTAMPTP